MAEPRAQYPFSAVVGQDDYKLALLANAVDPTIGGVLAVGDRGTAKSTLARGFAAVLAHEDAAAPFVELPLGATIDRLTGALDTAALLAGEGAVLASGLLAQADNGVLYVDEANLLGDHLVDVVLDAAAFGRIRTERDGISAESDARFVLVGTMNPEEGELRPQLLDRFGLMVQISSPDGTTERREILARRIEFERDAAGFVERFARTDAALGEIVQRARAALPSIELEGAQLDRIAEVCDRLNVEGVRADLAIARTASALAALDERVEVIDRDVETAARLALPHRARLEEETSSSGLGGSRPQFVDAATIKAALSGEPEPAESRPEPKTSAARRIPSSRGEVAPAVDRPDRSLAGRGPLGGSSRATGGERPVIDSTPNSSPQDLDAIATARAAVTRRLLGGENVDRADAKDAPHPDPMFAKPGEIHAADLRDRVRSGREANLVLCVVDASSSVLEGGRAGELRSLLGGLVSDARRKRDRVGLIVFRGRDARLVAPPSRNHAAVLAGLDTIEPGGTTPLAEGIRVAHETARRELRRNPDLRPVVVLVTDGYANIARSGDALAEARMSARDLKREGIAIVVIGETDSGAPQFARATGSEFYPFDGPADAERRDVA